MKSISCWNLYIAVVFASSFVGVECDYRGSAIYSRILNDADPLVPPSLNVTVRVGLDLIKILNIDASTQTMTAQVNLNLYWADASLAWKQNEFPTMNHVEVPSSRIWTPSIELLNSVVDVLGGQRGDDVRIYWNGLVRRRISAIFKSSCTIDVTYYPFDIQTCILKFGSANDLIHVALMEDTSSLRHFYDSITDEWALSGEQPAYQNIYKKKVGENMETDVTFYLTFKRRTHWMTQVCPSIFLAFLTLLPCLMPLFSEMFIIQIFCLTGLFSIAMEVSEILPPTAVATPSISNYVISLIIFNILHLTLTCTINNCNEDKLISLVERIPNRIFQKISKVMCLGAANNKEMETDSAENGSDGKQNKIDPTDDQIVALYHRILSVLIFLSVVIATMCFLISPPRFPTPRTNLVENAE